MEEPHIFILVCDLHLAAIYRKRLEASGIEVILLEDVDELKQRSSKIRPQVIVLDKDVVEDVAETLKEIKSLPTLTKTKTLVLARSMARDEVVNIRKAGADAIELFGHFGPHEFVQKIRKLIQLTYGTT